MQTSIENINNLKEDIISEKYKIMDSDGLKELTKDGIEISKKSTESSMVIQPDMQLIKTISLESVKQENIEKFNKQINESNDLRFLTESEKKVLKELNPDLSDKLIQELKINNNGEYFLNCRNEKLVGSYHEITNVKYIEKIIEYGNIKIKIVVPEFPTKFECNIPKELYNAGDREIFRYCTERLRDYLTNNPDMQSQFTKQQLEQIMNGEPYIKGLTWHHNEVPGKMQLVDAKIHAGSAHTGGNFIWCGGIR